MYCTLYMFNQYQDILELFSYFRHEVLMGARRVRIWNIDIKHFSLTGILVIYQNKSLGTVNQDKSSGKIGGFFMQIEPEIQTLKILSQ